MWRRGALLPNVARATAWRLPHGNQCFGPRSACLCRRDPQLAPATRIHRRPHAPAQQRLQTADRIAMLSFFRPTDSASALFLPVSALCSRLRCQGDQALCCQGRDQLRQARPGPCAAHVNNVKLSNTARPPIPTQPPPTQLHPHDLTTLIHFIPQARWAAKAIVSSPLPAIE